jgi:hypothetical protein
VSDARAFQGAFAAALHQPESSGIEFANPILRRALTVHRNTAAKAAQDALSANHPVTRALVGVDAFAACAAAFAVSHGPRDPRLCLYGEGFAEFVDSYAPFAALAYLKDIVALERLCTEALFATDASALDGSAFEGRIDPNAKLALHPAVRCAAFSSPAASIWLAHQGDSVDELLQAITWREEIALVTRPTTMVEVTAIDRPALAFLRASVGGRTISESAPAALELGADLTKMFAALIAAGAFAGYTTMECSQ